MVIGCHERPKVAPEMDAELGRSVNTCIFQEAMLVTFVRSVPPHPGT